MQMVKQNVPLDRLIDRLRALDEDALIEVSNFVESLSQKKAQRRQRLLDVVRERALPSATLEQVRADLSTITGSLSDVVTQLRHERG